MIKQYANNVFTHEGQSTVVDFGQEINTQPIKGIIEKVNNLKVYTGYHGTTKGDWDHDFNEQENFNTKQLANIFPNATLIWYTKPGMTDEEIRKAYNTGSAFFTWCDSDKKIRKVMEI